MQLEKVVAYHKALADPTRIRMLILLAEGELNGQALAEKLSLTPATITHHAAKLREASLINERRDKNTIYFTLNDYFIRSGAQGAASLIYRRTADSREENPTMDERMEKFRSGVLNNFFDKDGRLKSIPAQLKKKLIVLEHLAGRLEAGRSYEEKEINAFIKEVHDDFATIRREFIMHQFLFRDKEIYERNPVEMWPRWDALS
ncbi:metalloregulator ArsR/SmtB family transcription factor [Paenibacillus sp. D51F]